MKTIGIAVIGMGWMGSVHARAFSSLSRMDDVRELGIEPRLVFCSDEDAARLDWARRVFGFLHGDADWRRALERDDVHAVCIAAPTHLHSEMAVAAAQAGKHVYCEKPAGRNVAETRRAAQAVADAGVQSSCGYNYRHLPVVQYCRQLLRQGRFGAVEQMNARFLSMYGANPLSPLTWRFVNAMAGSGVVADILSHTVDMARFFAGDIARVMATCKTFIGERPLPAAGAGGHYGTAAADAPRGKVENEDYAGVLVEYANGAVGQLQASRVARGPKSEMGFALYGERGSAAWDFERMNELQLYLPDDNDVARDGYVRILGGGAHYGQNRINPGDGNGIGYEDSKLLEAVAFLRRIALAEEGGEAEDDSEDGMQQALRVAEVCDAVLRSRDSGQWEVV